MWPRRRPPRAPHKPDYIKIRELELELGIAPSALPDGTYAEVETWQQLNVLLRAGIPAKMKDRQT